MQQSVNIGLDINNILNQMPLIGTETASLDRFRNPIAILQVSVAQGPVDCLIVRQGWVDKIAKIENSDILGSKYYLLAKFIDIDSKEKLVCSHPVPATHVSTSIEYEEVVRHLLSYRGPHELTQGKIARAKLKVEDLHSREGSIAIGNGPHSKFSPFFVGAGSWS